jgi:sugar O-acyltransferase (sialic acid O-acetyltransferase NeuD family)|tara:strand:- start:847 stop:1476 length:630 start_codon:yes stop_codon:yes gene_type:complete
MKKIVVVGTGGLAREFTKFFGSHLEILGYLSLDAKEHDKYKLPGRFFSDEKNIEKIGTNLAVIAIQSSLVKRKIHEKMSQYGYAFPNFIHPSSVVTSSVKKEQGLIISPFCCIGANIKFGLHNYVNFSSGIGHDSQIGNFVHINSGVQIGGQSKLGDEVLVGSGATILQGLSIGNKSTIGLGSVVLSKVKNGVTVIGNPAKTLRIFDKS